MKRSLPAIFALAVGSFALAALAAAQTDIGQADQATLEKVKPPYSPYAGGNFPTPPLFGDTHLHTSFSMDAGAFGCRLGPRDAYRFARGGESHLLHRPTGQAVPATRPTAVSLTGDEKSRKQARCYYGTDGKVQKVPIASRRITHGKSAPRRHSPLITDYLSLFS